jgi:single-strand DNA-binding protein
MDINQVTLVGRLAENVKYTQGTDATSSRAVARLIVNRPPGKNGERRYDAIQVVAWGVHADNMASYTSKGKELAITGELRVNNVAPTTPQGEWKNYTEVQIRTLSFGRDSNNAKVMKALQGTEGTLSAAQAALTATAGGDSLAAAALANSPEIKKILDQIIKQGTVAPGAPAAPPAAPADLPPAEEAAPAAEPEAEEQADTPFSEA